MGFPIDFILAYLLGGFTFIPAILALGWLHAYLTFPTHNAPPELLKSGVDSLQRSCDDGTNVLRKSAEIHLESFQSSHEPDVAAGYFAVCREYVPGGINGKPPERTTPAGAVVVAESPSVYQSMYRSIFDRRQPPTLDAAKGNGRAIKRARNVFFVVLRHGHLMLYEDSEQLEVKHVISLEHHNISIYGGDGIIPEGELWIKRNAILLTRKARIEEGTSKPFFLFSDNCSEKEDFYFALLQNQEAKAGAHDNPPRPQQYDPKHMIGLVQMLHSSEEQLQTRWVNGLIGRLFLALYNTSEIEEYIRKKVTKKIARAKKPAFLSGIVLQKIDMGESTPQLTNPRLKDLNIDGDCCVEADLRYNGNFRLQIAATARLDLGARFRAREVNLVLAVVVKKLHGHGLLKIKPSPSNRVWVTFATMPDMELSIEPIVSSRQITYGVIHRAIESRIREVIAETIVFPHWDDSAFLDTTHQKFRGGIWADAEAKDSPQKEHAKIPDESPEDEADLEVNTAEVTLSTRSKEERAMSLQSMADIGTADKLPKFSPDLSQVLAVSNSGRSFSSIPKTDKPPKALRSTSFASAANPLLTHASADLVQRKQPDSTKQQRDATTAMIAISSRSRPTSPTDASAEPFPIRALKPDDSGLSSKRSPDISVSDGSVDRSTIHAAVSDSPEQTSAPSTPTSVDSLSSKSAIDSETIRSAAAQLRSGSTTSSNKKQSIAAIGVATAAAKKWGWGVLARNTEQKNLSSGSDPDRAGTPEHPIGRGRPLPPLGQPLPFPDGQRSKTIPALTPKRKPLPPPLQPQRHPHGSKARSSPVPPLSIRRRQSSTHTEETHGDGLLVVQAPDSEPPSPSDFFNDVKRGEHVAGGKEVDFDLSKMDLKDEGRSETRSDSDGQFVDGFRKILREDDTALTSWQSSQEEAQRSKSVWMDSHEHS